MTTSKYSRKGSRSYNGDSSDLELVTLTLQAVDGNADSEPVKSFTKRDGEVVVGRASRSAIPAEEPGEDNGLYRNIVMSRKHATFNWTSDGITLNDADSTHGTRVYRAGYVVLGAAYSSPFLIENGDYIVFGRDVERKEITGEVKTHEALKVLVSIIPFSQPVRHERKKYSPKYKLSKEELLCATDEEADSDKEFGVPRSTEFVEDDEEVYGNDTATFAAASSQEPDETRSQSSHLDDAKEDESETDDPAFASKEFYLPDGSEHDCFLDETQKGEGLLSFIDSLSSTFIGFSQEFANSTAPASSGISLGDDPAAGLHVDLDSSQDAEMHVVDLDSSQEAEASFKSPKLGLPHIRWHSQDSLGMHEPAGSTTVEAELNDDGSDASSEIFEISHKKKRSSPESGDSSFASEDEALAKPKKQYKLTLYQPAGQPARHGAGEATSPKEAALKTTRRIKSRPHRVGPIFSVGISTDPEPVKTYDKSTQIVYEAEESVSVPKIKVSTTVPILSEATLSPSLPVTETSVLLPCAACKKRKVDELEEAISEILERPFVSPAPAGKHESKRARMSWKRASLISASSFVAGAVAMVAGLALLPDDI